MEEKDWRRGEEGGERVNESESRFFRYWGARFDFQNREHRARAI